MVTNTRNIFFAILLIIFVCSGCATQANQTQLEKLSELQSQKEIHEDIDAEDEQKKEESNNFKQVNTVDNTKTVEVVDQQSITDIYNVKKGNFQYEIRSDAVYFGEENLMKSIEADRNSFEVLSQEMLWAKDGDNFYSHGIVKNEAMIFDGDYNYDSRKTLDIQTIEAVSDYVLRDSTGYYCTEYPGELVYFDLTVQQVLIGRLFKTDNGDVYACTRQLLNFDEDTYSEVNQMISRDKNNVYCIDGYTSYHFSRIEEADPDTFIHMASIYFRDEDTIFMLPVESEGWCPYRTHYDAATFRILDAARYHVMDKHILDLGFSQRISLSTELDIPSFKRFDSQYYRDKNSLFYVDERILIKLEDADVSTFEVIRSPLYRDKDSLFFDNTKVENVDVQSFEFIDETYAKDDNQLYFIVYRPTGSDHLQVLSDVDIQSFEVLDYGYARDKDNVYISIWHHDKPPELKKVQDVDSKSFTILSSHLAKDNERLYLLNTPSGNTTSITKIQATGDKKLQGQFSATWNGIYQGVFYLDVDMFDVDNFDLYDSFYGSDGNNVFFFDYTRDRHGEITGVQIFTLTKADVSSFEVWGEGYATTKDFLYIDGVRYRY